MNSTYLNLFLLCSGSIYKFFCSISPKKFKRKKFKDAYCNIMINLAYYYSIKEPSEKKFHKISMGLLESRDWYNQKFIVMITALYNIFESYIKRMSAPSSEFFVNFV